MCYNAPKVKKDRDGLGSKERVTHAVCRTCPYEDVGDHERVHREAEQHAFVRDECRVEVGVIQRGD